MEVESGGEKFVAEADQIVLSSGAIGSPQIMLLSGVGPAAHLKEMGLPVVHDLPGVGQNLRDHPMIYVTFKTKPDFPLDGFAPSLLLRMAASPPCLRRRHVVFQGRLLAARRSSSPPRLPGPPAIYTADTVPCRPCPLLLGLAANAALGWWWADPLAALVMVPWLIHEGREGFERPDE